MTTQERIEEIVEALQVEWLWKDTLNGEPVPLYEMTPNLAYNLRAEFRKHLTRLADEIRAEAYANGYKQGNFDAETTAEYGEPQEEDHA